jgi:hypothetical protein
MSATGVEDVLPFGKKDHLSTEGVKVKDDSKSFGETSKAQIIPSVKTDKALSWYEHHWSMKLTPTITVF